MSHDIDETSGKPAMAYVGETPWHGLGEQLQPGQPIEAWVKAARLDWQIETLPVQYLQRTLSELEEEQKELLQQRGLLQQQLATAEALESVKQQRQALDQQLAQLDAELRDFTEMQALQQSEAGRQERLAELERLLASLAATLDQSAGRNKALDQQRQQLQRGR